MANMIFDNEESYLNMIRELLQTADIFTLDKILNILLKHIYPKYY